MSFSQRHNSNFDCLEIICFSSKKAKLYCVWFSDDENDGFLLDDSALRVFPSENLALECLKAFPSYKKAIKTTTYDIDEVKRIASHAIPLNAHMILDFWNIVNDLAKSIQISYKGHTEDSLTNRIYDKLFYGNNLPEINTSNRIYVPQFTSEEYARLLTVLSDGITIVEFVFAKYR